MWGPPLRALGRPLVAIRMAIQMATTDLFDGQLDEAVIDEDAGARPHIPGQVLIGDGNFLNAG